VKLHWSPNAPFVRKVLIVAHEAGVETQIEKVRSPVGLTRINPEVLKDNPLNKLPTLVTDAGEAIYDSRVICAYLNELGGADIIPAEPARRWTALRQEAMCDGILDTVILLRDEILRGERHRSPAHVAHYEAKFAAFLEQAEREVPGLAARPFDIGHIAFGVALSYFDFRPGFHAEWRPGHPALTDWYESFEARPSAKATIYPGERAVSEFGFYKFPDDAPV
jgi:glutathione S-transferase